MKSKNRYFGSNTFVNYEVANKSYHRIFLLPTIIITPRRSISWEISAFSLIMAWFGFFIQFNICSINKTSNKEIYKKNVQSLITILAEEGIRVNDANKLLDYLTQYSQITLILKNANLQHNYIKKTLRAMFINVDFVTVDKISN